MHHVPLLLHLLTTNLMPVPIKTYRFVVPFLVFRCGHSHTPIAAWCWHPVWRRRRICSPERRLHRAQVRQQGYNQERACIGGYRMHVCMHTGPWHAEHLNEVRQEGDSFVSGR